MRAQAEVPSARRTDTPKQFRANRARTLAAEHGYQALVLTATGVRQATGLLRRGNRGNRPGVPSVLGKAGSVRFPRFPPGAPLVRLRGPPGTVDVLYLS